MINRRQSHIPPERNSRWGDTKPKGSRSSAGFTFVEVLLVMTISGIITAVVAIGIFQVLQGSKRNRDHLTALRQVQNAGFWVGRDTLMAQTITVGDDLSTPGVEFIVLDWVDWSDGDKTTITYTLEDMPGALKRLMRRNKMVDQLGTTVKWDGTTQVADRISTASFTQQSGVWRLDVQARSGNQTESGQYSAQQRLDL
ncbi:MAG: prepilin-type N-terminal cleavage/methylation domain-containing protein [Chloroflexi bacterium]|nr:prepilin-type N-terminal cleavage/methylation domain-containing protein [Chloroflexota bacterium]